MTGSPGFVDLLAVRELRRRGVLPEGSTIVPGHTGDFVSGSWIPGRLWKKSRGTRADVVDAVLDTYYKYRDPHLIATLLSREEADIATALRDRASASLAPSSDSLEREELVSLSEQWGWRQRQAKFIANGVRIYDRHGMRWSLPWWDRDVLDYWCRVPLEMRIAQRLRSMIADRVGWPTKALPSSHRLERTVQTIVRRTGFDGAAKRLLFRWRRASAGMQYRHDPLGSYALFGDHVATEYRGTQTPRALLAPDVLAALARA